MNYDKFIYLTLSRIFNIKKKYLLLIYLYKHKTQQWNFWYQKEESSLKLHVVIGDKIFRIYDRFAY